MKKTNKKIIATTTINYPTEAIYKYIEREGWDIIIAGDLKTPEEEYRQLEQENSNVLYLSPDDQNKINGELSELIGFNKISRRNFSIIAAFKNNADFIALVDDDNIPLDNWGDIKISNNPTKCTQYYSKQDAFDPLFVTNYKHLWHRGFPLQWISSRRVFGQSEVSEVFDIQANFWNGDPDIDAICRMEHRPECFFETDIFPFTGNKTAPFNSQNTILKREVVPHYFLFPGIGRMEDIWAAYYVQSLGFKVLFDEPTVYQKRNAHDLTKDFLDESQGIWTSNLILDLKKKPDNLFRYLPEGSLKLFELYQKELYR